MHPQKSILTKFVLNNSVVSFYDNFGLLFKGSEDTETSDGQKLTKKLLTKSLTTFLVGQSVEVIFKSLS